MEKREILLNNRKVVYRTIGKGPLVLLIHGFGEDGTVWRNQWNELEGFRLLIPDLPGSGESEISDDMSMEGLAETVRQILVAEKNLSPSESSEKVVMIGHSMGGYVTLAFAEKHPEMLHGFGLFHSTAFADSEEKKQIRRKGIDFIQKHGAFEFLNTSISNLFSHDTKDQKPELIQEQIDSLHNFSASALVNYYEAMIRRPDRTNVLKQAKVPVLFILGRTDSAVPLEDGLKLCHMPEISYIHILEHSGHMGMMEEPKQANTILKTYLHSIYHQTQ